MTAARSRWRKNVVFALLLCLMGGRAWPEDWGSIKIESVTGGVAVTMENSKLRLKYAPNSHDGGMVNFILKEINDDLAGGGGGKRLDASHHRYAPKSAEIVEDGPTQKTVHIHWPNDEENPTQGYCDSEVTIFKGSCVVRIRYLKMYINIFEWARFRGADRGVFEIYGADEWQKLRGWPKKYPTIKDTMTPDGVYWSAKEYGDPGPLLYDGMFIMGVHDRETGSGYGRVMPHKHISRMFKLMADPNPCGYEFFPGRHYYAADDFYGYLFGVTSGGGSAIVAMGKKIADGVLPGPGGDPGTPENIPPVAKDQSVSAAAGQPMSIQLSYTDSDGPGPYVFTVTEQPQRGALSGSGQSLTYTADAGYLGSDSFKWKVNDGKADSNVATVTITVKGNQSPTAKDASVSVKQGSSVNVSLEYTDPDGPGPYTFTITQQPAGGNLSGTGGSRTYTPDGGFSGTDSFEWKVNDGKVDSNVATVTITVAANQPPAVTDQSVAVVQDTPLQFRLLFSDADGSGPLEVRLVDPPDHGTVSFGGGMCTYTPESGYSGPDSFRYAVTDSVTESAVATVTIDVQEDSDGDGLPDGWEVRYGLDPDSDDTDGDGVKDGHEDEDFDGSTNAEEYRQGRDPTAADGAPASTGFGCAACARPYAATGAAFVLCFLVAAARRVSGRADSSRDQAAGGGCE